MSFEAWGTPPDPEPRYCPVCDQESHSNECELGKMQARAFLAEQQRDELLAAMIHIQQVACSGSPELGIATNAIASAKEKQNEN